VPTQLYSRTGRWEKLEAEHRERCEARVSCTVLGGPGGESPPGHSTGADILESIDEKLRCLLPFKARLPII
jgi:hypothetical protein